MARRKTPVNPPKSDLIQAGDTIIMADKKEYKVVNLLWLNGEPGVHIDYPNALFPSDSFHLLRDVDVYVREWGTWAVRRAP